MFGVGNPFGFRQVTTFGRLLREACAREDFEAAGEIVNGYGQYLDQVQVSFVDAPPKRAQWEPRSIERRQESVPVPVERRMVERRGRASNDEVMRNPTPRPSFRARG